MFDTARTLRKTHAKYSSTNEMFDTARVVSI